MIDQCIYLHNWVQENWEYRKRRDAVISDFAIAESDLEGVSLLLASYAYEDYSGYAFVLFEKDGRLYEVNGSHCSCYGLEGQWEPEETSIIALRDRLEKGTLGQWWMYSEFATELTELLLVLEL